MGLTGYFRLKGAEPGIQAQPSNLSALQSEIQKLWPNMIALLMTPVTLPKMTSPISIFDLFTSAEPTQTLLWKRLYIDKELEEKNVHVKLLEDERFELAVKRSKHEKEMWLAHEHYRLRDICPFG